MILAGDIGGTKTILALFEEKGAGLRPVRDATFANADHGTFKEVLKLFLREETASSVESGCFGVAGAVINGRTRMTNLNWELNESVLAEALGVKRVKLLNDLAATAYGMVHLSPDDLKALNPAGQKGTGNIAVIAAGTGLGEAMLYWDGSQYQPSASEGGHADFAPRSDLEIKLLRYLREKLKGRVSYERVLSGPGLLNIYSFLRDSAHGTEPPWLTEKLKTGDPSATISQLGVTREEPLCTEALDLFTSIYGAEAGNLALKCLATGGVYVGGGIAPKILPALERGAFLNSFGDKGRFSPLLKRMELKVSLNPGTALLGAAHFARRVKNA
ncbi:MAG TPA: glucokinase [Candidatus Binatia bacterium]